MPYRIRISEAARDEIRRLPGHVRQRVRRLIRGLAGNPTPAGAKELRGVIKAMDKLFPGLGEHLEQETTVAIDGELHEIAYGQPVKPGAEVFFIPKIEGG